MSFTSKAVLESVLAADILKLQGDTDRLGEVNITGSSRLGGHGGNCHRAMNRQAQSSRLRNRKRKHSSDDMEGT